MSRDICIDGSDIVIAKNRKTGEKYYVAGKYDEFYEWDFDCAPVGRLITWHRRYNIGTKHDYDCPGDFWEDVIKGYYGYAADPEHSSYNSRALASSMLSYTSVYIDRDEDDTGEVYYYLRRKDGGPRWKDSRIWGYLSTDKVEEMTDDDTDSFWEALHYLNEDDYEALVHVFFADFVYYPIFLYDHGGLVLSMGEFNDPWDSGWIGFFCATRKEVESELGLKDCTWTQAFHDYVKARIDEYNEWQLGNVWTYTEAPARKLDECKEIVEEFKPGLWREKLADAIAKQNFNCWSGGIAGDYDYGMRAWCEENDLEIVGVLEK